MINKIILVGRLTRDPELKEFGNDKKVCKFSLAVDRRFGKQETDFVNIDTWNKLAEICDNNLEKGRLVAVEGSLRINQSEDKEGNKRSFTSVNADNVVFLDKKKSDVEDEVDDMGEEVEDEIPF